MVVFFYCPAFPLALPDCIFNLRNELDKEDCNGRLTSGGQDESILDHARNGYETIVENEQEPVDRHENPELIPTDDANPITCSTLLLEYVQRLPEIRLPFTMKLAIFLFCIAPFIFYVQLGVYLTFKHEYLDRVPPGTQTGTLNFNCAQSLKTPSGLFGFVLWAFFAFVFALFLRPKDLFLRENSQRFWYEFYEAFSEITRTTITLPGAALHVFTTSVGDLMIFHLRVLQPVMCSLFVSYFSRVHNKGLKKLLNLAACSLPRKRIHDVSRTRLALGILWVQFSILPALLVGLALGAICLLLLFIALLLFLVSCSPFSSLLFVLRAGLGEIWANISNKYVRYSLAVVFYILFILLYLFFPLAISISSEFIVGILGFTIMGLVLNVEIVTLYVAFLVVVATNIYLATRICRADTRKSRDLFYNSGKRNHKQNAGIGTQFHQICFGS